MNKKKILAILIIFLCILSSSIIIQDLNIFNTDGFGNNIFDKKVNINNTNQSYYDSVLGSNNYGFVQLLGPFGNTSSDIKIAYIIGVHPAEHKIHSLFFESLLNSSSSLKYSYYIYKINIADGENASYGNGRSNGQYLARDFIVPDIKSKANEYKLVVDIHSNHGRNGGTYDETNFIFAPLNDSKSKAIAEILISKIPPLVYYYPSSQTSPNFVTIPIQKAGIPAIIYETYIYESEDTTLNYINKLIPSVDTLSF
ncbi:MAG: adhesin [Methanobrevibacter sp.]|jgi:hypothetical protein|nr:adhesin [Candidatus Methanoflexus mossambicus]